MQEVWKPVKGYEGYYKVSNFGRVKSLDRYVKHSRNPKHKYLKRGALCSLNDNGNGYLQVHLYQGGKSSRRVRYIHRLVADAFIPNIKNKPQVNHINGDKADNFVDNLEWVTSKENNNHAEHTGLNKIFKEKRIQVDLFRLNGDFIKSFNSILDCSKFLQRPIKSKIPPEGLVKKQWGYVIKKKS